MNEAEEIKASVPLTLSISMQDLLDATVGTIPPYSGNPDDEWEPHPVAGLIIDRAARLLSLELSRDERSGYRTRYRDAIQERLGVLVEEELQKPFLPVDTYGEPKRGAEPTTLRAEIGRQAADALAKGMSTGETYSGTRRGVGSLRKYIETEIDRQIKGELQAAVTAAKAAVVDKVKANVSQVITDTITRTAVR